MIQKASLRLLLAVLLVAVTLGGCAPAAVEPTPTVEPVAEEKEATPVAEELGEPVELIWLMGGPIPLDQAMAEEKLNEISVAELNVTMKTLYYDNERTMLALSTGEPWDITFTSEWFNNFAIQARAGYFADLTDLLPTVAPRLWASMPEIVWEGAKVDGRIYAVPVKKDYAAEIFWILDKGLFEDALGMQIPDTMSFTDVEPFLAAAKQAHADGVPGAERADYPLYLARGGVGGLTSGFDMIHRGAMLGIPYSAAGTADGDKIVVIVEHPDLMDRLVAVRRWFEAGYINPDAATLETTEMWGPATAGQGFYGADPIWTGWAGFPVKSSKFCGPHLSTASIRGAMNAINAASPHIELALRHRELVHTHKRYADILRYGVEGVHFNYTEDGLVARTDTGKTNYGPWPFAQGSYALSSVEAVEGVEVDPNMWAVIFEGYKDLVATNAIGFSFDIVPVEEKVAALQVVADKYWAGLVTGTFDPEVEVPKMIAEMEAAGLRDVQAEAQRQFDAFLAEKAAN